MPCAGALDLSVGRGPVCETPGGRLGILSAGGPEIRGGSHALGKGCGVHGGRRGRPGAVQWTRLPCGGFRGTGRPS